VGEQLAHILRMVLELLEGSHDLVCVARDDRVLPFVHLLEVAGLGSDERNDTRRPGIDKLGGGFANVSFVRVELGVEASYAQRDVDIVVAPT
jgi:hypothetical protein